MARPKLSSPQQPPWLRLALQIYEFLASLQLAVVVISGSAIVLAWATYIDNLYGHESKAVHHGVYGTAWFAGLIFLLGLNVLCAAAIRFPWKRYQTGFVITHWGILVLLAGCLLSRLGGIDAQMPIYEGTSSYRAFEDTQHIRLKIRGTAVGDRVPAEGERHGGRRAEVIDIPFASGPFNWEDYGKTLAWFPWGLSHRDRGVLYDEEGVRLEVLDYCSDVTTSAGPPLVLQVKTLSKQPPAADAKDGWTRLELAIGQEERMGRSTHPGAGRVARQPMNSGHQVVFRVATSQAEVEAFLHSVPEGELGPRGQLVLWVEGKAYHFSAEELKPAKRVPIGTTGLELEYVPRDEMRHLDVAMLGLLIYAPGESPRKMSLVADVPEFDVQDEEHGVFGTYWVDRTAKSSAATPADHAQILGRPRLDLLQGPDGKLYYRAWRSSRVEAIGEVPAGREPSTAFAGTDDAMTWLVEQFSPHDRPGLRIEPAPYRPRSLQSKSRYVRLRLTVDGQSEVFWLEGLPAIQFDEEPEENQRRTVFGRGRRVEATLAWDEVDVGFRVFLHKFDRRLDPGTSMASHYGSVVDFRDRQQPTQRLLDQEFQVELNEPVNFKDPHSGRSYRLYQESFNGPWKPGDPPYKYVLAKTGVVPEGDELFSSTLTVNYDPGRGLKYAGSLLVIAGVATMFYMRAYFFKWRPGAAIDAG